MRVERDGLLLAEPSRPRLLFELLLPVRFYLLIVVDGTPLERPVTPWSAR